MMLPRTVPPEEPGLPISWLVAALLARGLPEAVLAEKLDLDLPALHSAGAATTAERYNHLFEWSARELRDPALGLNVAGTIDVRQFGVLGYLAENAATVRDLCLLVAHYHEVFTRYFGLSFVRSGSLCHFDYRAEPVPGSDARQDIDFTFGVLAATIRQKISPDWKPLSCSFTFPQPACRKAHHAALGPNLRFGQAQNRMTFHHGILESQIPGADPGLLTILKQQADAMLSRSQSARSLSQTVRLMLSSHLGPAGLTAENTATSLNMSVRKLHRMLSAEGTSFRRLRDAVICFAAREALEFSSAPVSEIAVKLGYSETSAFTRAFTRTAGVSPKAFRERAVRRCHDS
ncbi:AraC family transcriptional regulator ligand-binding domain-containing protein [Roseobacteraceae bacterium NS-SX3]